MTPTHKREIQLNDITSTNHSKLYNFIGPRGLGIGIVCIFTSPNSVSPCLLKLKTSSKLEFKGPIMLVWESESVSKALAYLESTA
jgi:hypothetical protein